MVERDLEFDLWKAIDPYSGTARDSGIACGLLSCLCFPHCEKETYKTGGLFPDCCFIKAEG